MLLYHSLEFHSNSDSSCRTDCEFTTTPHTLTSSASFSSCKWISCTGENGGGIHLKANNNSFITLSVMEGEFISSTASNRGGVIYAEGKG